MATSPELQSTSESQFTVRDCYPLDQDPRLPDLALYTAQSLHRIHGLPFDAKSHSLELVRQVKFVVIKIGLPLGGKYWNFENKFRLLSLILSQFCFKRILEDAG
jgi:hypothetical protein